MFVIRGRNNNSKDISKKRAIIMNIKQNEIAQKFKEISTNILFETLVLTRNTLLFNQVDEKINVYIGRINDCVHNLPIYMSENNIDGLYIEIKQLLNYLEKSSTQLDGASIHPRLKNTLHLYESKMIKLISESLDCLEVS